MYNEFFGLHSPPFRLTPDANFLYLSKGHSKALSFLRYGVYKEEGFIVVTGEVGTGKTTLIQSLVTSLNKNEVIAGKVVYSRLNADDLLRTVLASFNLRYDNLSKTGMLRTLEEFFQFNRRGNKRVLLIVDEAQNLTAEALEELRMLSNLELDGEPLLQTFLLGQPEFRRMMQAPEFRQLLQRVTAAYHLGPLEQEEVSDYVLYRLHIAGSSGKPTFAPGVSATLYRHTGGIPRRLNTLCDRVMLSAFLDHVDRIDSERVETVANELETELGGAIATDADTHRAVGENTLGLNGYDKQAVAPLDKEHLTPQQQQGLSRLEQTMDEMRRALRNLLGPGR
ncbi:MAG: DUF2075 domain-containing protein [Burkholderiaceae bacterium]|nr:MAG: DUF2075 domain-containing protein [Burkholderiaceae bacterium]